MEIKTHEGVQVLAVVSPRVETGPLQFGNDWTGLFIRGDDCFAFAKALNKCEISDRFVKVTLRELCELLESSHGSVEYKVEFLSENRFDEEKITIIGLVILFAVSICMMVGLTIFAIVRHSA